MKVKGNPLRELRAAKTTRRKAARLQGFLAEAHAAPQHRDGHAIKYALTPLPRTMPLTVRASGRVVATRSSRTLPGRGMAPSYQSRPAAAEIRPSVRRIWMCGEGRMW